MGLNRARWRPCGLFGKDFAAQDAGDYRAGELGDVKCFINEFDALQGVLDALGVHELPCECNNKIHSFGVLFWLYILIG